MIRRVMLAAAVLAICGAVAGCPKPPPTPPIGPGGAGGAMAAGGSPGTGGLVVQPPEGPAPLGDATVCANTCRHVAKVCITATVEGCKVGCIAAGGADPYLIPCLNAAASCEDATACNKPDLAGGGGGPIQHGR